MNPARLTDEQLMRLARHGDPLHRELAERLRLMNDNEARRQMAAYRAIGRARRACKS